MAPLRDALHINGIGNKLNDGVFNGDTNDISQLNTAIDDLLWWSRALSAARVSD